MGRWFEYHNTALALFLDYILSVLATQNVRTTSPSCGIVPDLVIWVIPHAAHAQFLGGGKIIVGLLPTPDAQEFDKVEHLAGQRFGQGFNRFVDFIGEGHGFLI